MNLKNFIGKRLIIKEKIASPIFIIEKIDNIIITGTSSTSIIDETQPEIFSFYPNPARTSIFINYAEKSKYEIVSIEGKTLKTGTLIKMIDVSDLRKGIYLFEIKNEKGVFIKKLIIQ